jgi:hypothetical protein
MRRSRVVYLVALALMVALCGHVAAASTGAAPPSFKNEIIPLFTRLGCNQGACHGKNEGRNGFKLSLRGYAPEWDYERLTRESRGRRLNLAYPEQSLLLQKAAGRIPHGGGALLVDQSREYQLLLDWIRAGAPRPGGGEPRLEAIALSPGDQTLSVGDQVQLAVEARYSDGARRDVTWLTQFYSNDAAVVEVSASGMMCAKRNGETAVRAHFDGQVAVAIATIPFDQSVKAGQYANWNSFIDEHVFRKLAALRIPASPLAEDAAFVRRVFLDTIGTLPTPAEVLAFVADADSQKRAKLIDNLLARPEYVDYWAVRIGDLLQNRKERDHDVRGAKDVRAMHAWLREQIARNRPWNELARDVLTAKGPSDFNPEVGYYVVTVGESRNADQSEVVASVAQAFLGTRIGCAKCHNHPLERYTQDDYYHFAAFFAPLQLKRQDSKKGPTVLSIASVDGRQQGRRRRDQQSKPAERIGVVQPRTGRFLAPQTLDGTKCEAAPGDDPRVKLADWITDPENQYFAGAMVNRIWRHYMGVGLVEPVDDLRASNPPSNPALWKALVTEFTSHGYDMKQLTRVILNSSTYQLSSATVAGNAADSRFYSHYLARRLPAEVLLDAISQATDRPEEFKGYPLGIRAIQLPDPGLESYFLTQFGRSERVTACACERRGEVTIGQLLQLQNGRDVIEKINHDEGRLARLLSTEALASASGGGESPDDCATGTDATSGDSSIIDELFLATLSRKPTADEYAAVTSAIAVESNREEAFRDLFWALLNSKEFAFNH